MSAAITSEDALPAADTSGGLNPLAAAALDTLLATMPLGVLALAADGTVTMLNPAATALWGVPAVAVLGHTPAQVQPAVLPPALMQALAEVAPAAGPYWLPHTQQWISLRTAPAAEGSRWVYWENSPVSQPAVPGTPPPAGTSPEAEAEYRTLVEGMTQGFCVIEVLFDDAQQPVDYRFLVANPAFGQQTGLHNVVGHTMRALRPAHEAHWFAQYGQVARTGEPTWFTHVAEQLGRVYKVYAFRVGDPAAHKVAIMFCDISGLRQTEQALHESEASYHTLLNSIDEGYFLCDVLFDQQGVPVDMLYLDANPAATRLVGADFRGKRLRELDPTYESYWFEIFGRVARTGVGERLERYAEPDKKWYNFYAFKAGNEASPRVGVVFQDITARKQHEQALRASEAQVAADLAGMRRLYELQAKLADQDDVQAALRDVLAAACEFTGTDRGCVQLLSRDGQRLEMAVWQGYPDDSPFINFFRYEGLETGCEVTRVQRQRLIIEDTVGFEGLEGTEAGAATYADGIRAAQSTPMTNRSEKTIGVISTQFRQPHRPSDHALRLLDMLAWTAAEFLERHRAEAARRESEQQFRLMADAVPQIVWLTDAEGRVEFFNQQWSDYTGVPYEPTTAAEVAASFVHPDDEAATMAAFTEARATGTTFLVEHRIRSRAGDYRWFLVRAEPHRAADTGEIIRWFGASVDIHDRKQTEVALEKAHERLQLALNTGRIFSFEMNPATRTLELSDNVDLVMGFPLPDHIDSTFELIHPDDLQPTVDLINGAINARGSYASEYRLVNPANGDVVWFHSQAAFTQRKTSGEWCFAGIAQNITASKQAEVALRASEEKYRTLFDTMDQGFAVCELVRDEAGRAVDFRYLELNPIWEQQTGLRRDQTLGRTAKEVIPGIEDWWLQAYARVVDTNEPMRFEHYAEAFDQWYQVLAFPQGGQRFATIYDDITDRKQAEQLVQQSAARQAYLLTLSDALRSVGDAVGIQAAATDTAMHYFGADRCYYCELAGDTVTIRRDAARPGLPSVAAVYSLATMPIFQALLQASQPVVVADVRTSTGMDDNLKQLCLGFGIIAYINVPVIKSGEQVGMLCLTQGTPREWTALETALMQETAERTWAAVERAQSEAALRASEALLQRAFAIDTVGMLFFSLDGRMTNANAAFKRISGYSRKALLAADWEVLTAPEFRDVTARAVGELADRGETAPYEKQMVRPDGSRWWALCAPTRLRGEGDTAECMEFTIDISKRKEAEEQLQAFTASLEQLVAERTQELRASHERLNTIFEAVPLQLGYYEAVRDDQSQLVDLRTVTVNHGSANQMELLSNEPGQLVSAQLPGLQALPVWHTMTQVIETGQPQRLELRHDFGTRTVWFDVLYTRLGDGLISASLDITARKQMEEQLRENQAVLQSAFDTSLISLSVLHAVRDENGAVQDFRIVIANKELEKETGRTDLVGKLYAQEYPGIKPAGLYDAMLHTLETGEPVGLEYYYEHEGFNKWYTCQFVKMDDGLVATNLDISERKLAEEKIKEQAHFIARVNETLPDLMTVTELPSGQVVYVNQDPYEAPGFERENLLNIPLQGQTDLLRMHPDDAALLPDYFARAAVLADHEIATYSYRAKFDTDQWRSFQVRGSVFQRDPATGAATQILSVAQDVTKQREAELQQAKSYQLLQQSEEVASLGSWDYDRATGEFQWSAGMYRLFGLAPGSPLRPATYLDFALPEDRPVAERIVRGLTTGRTGFEETLRIQVGDAVKTLRVKAVVNEASDPVRVLGVDLDISEVQRLEAENLHMRLTQQQALFGAVLEAQETERQRMAESLHNGLGQILYAAKLQLNQLQDSHPPTALTRADQLLADAIRQTRTLSHELVPMVLTEFGLQAALQDICHTLRNPRLQFDCAIELQAQHPLSQPLQIAIYRMAQELAQNVVKHAQATEASLAVETVPGFVLLRVEDNGRGFAPASSVSSGIGLRAIRDQVALFGGTIEMGASPTFGTYVRLRLPLPPAATLPA